MAQEAPPPQIILLPELSVPLGFLPNLRTIAAQMNAVIMSSSGEGRLVGIGCVMRNCPYGQP
jgi:hypothetical protein